MKEEQILHYRILKKLGEGGMGIVYLAEDTKLKRQVAIKFLPGHVAANSEERERFKIEAQAAAALNHPNITQIYSIEETDDDIFIVMEYIDGHELKSIVRADSESAPTMDEIVDYAIQIASGLHVAHEKGIIHRDIKSSNIMITDKGQAKIMDFGLAKLRDSAHVTREGTTLGTAAYMSPEQARGDDVDERSDIWSLGVVFYEMLVKRLPFKGTYEQAVIYSILNEEPESLSTLNLEIDEQIVDIVQRTLAKGVDQRYQTVSDFMKDLEAVKKTKLDDSDEIEQLFTFSNLVRQPKILIPSSILVIFLVVITFWWIDKINKEKWARQTILPAIEEVIKDLP